MIPPDCCRPTRAVTTCPGPPPRAITNEVFPLLHSCYDYTLPPTSRCVYELRFSLLNEGVVISAEASVVATSWGGAVKGGAWCWCSTPLMTGCRGRATPCFTLFRMSSNLASFCDCTTLNQELIMSPSSCCSICDDQQTSRRQPASEAQRWVGGFCSHS